MSVGNATVKTVHQNDIVKVVLRNDPFDYADRDCGDGQENIKHSSHECLQSWMCRRRWLRQQPKKLVSHIHLNLFAFDGIAIPSTPTVLSGKPSLSVVFPFVQLMPPNVCMRLFETAIDLREIRMQEDKRQPGATSVGSDMRMGSEFEPDPMLRLSEGRASRFQMVLVGLVGIAIICTVAWAMLSGGYQ